MHACITEKENEEGDLGGPDQNTCKRVHILISPEWSRLRTAILGNEKNRDLSLIHTTTTTKH